MTHLRRVALPLLLIALLVLAAAGTAVAVNHSGNPKVAGITATGVDSALAGIIMTGVDTALAGITATGAD